MVWLGAAVAFMGGAFLWGLLEYVMHRWVGHTKRGRNFFSKEHLAHHAKSSYFAPTYKKVLAAALVTAVFGPPLVWLLGAAIGGALLGGFLLAYGAYEVLHRRIHTSAPLNAYGEWARRHHLHHHFGSPKMNHGVTSPLWDLVFRTYVRPKVIRVPARQPLPWLYEPVTGNVRQEYAHHYVKAYKGSKLAETAA